jgi:hypothetical protein
MVDEQHLINVQINQVLIELVECCIYLYIMHSSPSSSNSFHQCRKYAWDEG